MNDSSTSLDNGQTNDMDGESIQEQIQKLFQEIIGHHDTTVKRKNASRWYGQLDSILLHLDSITSSNLKQMNLQKGKRKRNDKEEKESDPQTPQSVKSDFKWASNKIIHLNQSAQKRIETLNKQMAITDVSMSPLNLDKQKKFKPVRPKQPEVALSPMKDISNIMKTNGNANTNANTNNVSNGTSDGNSNGGTSMDVDDDKCDDDVDEFLRSFNVSSLVGDETLS